MSQQQNPVTAQPQYSPDGKWWWTGTHWVPVQPKRGMSGRAVALVLGLVAAAVVVLILLVFAVSQPIGTQVPMDEDLDDSFCQMFPEDC